MACVDLNPIRACMADRPETSDYTNIQERLDIEPAATNLADTQLSRDDNDKRESLKLAELLPFAGNEHITNKPQHIPFDLMEYIQLADWTGIKMLSHHDAAAATWNEYCSARSSHFYSKRA